VFFGGTLPGYLHNLDMLRERQGQRADAAIGRPESPVRAPGDSVRSSQDFTSRLAALLETSATLSAAREPQAMMELFCERARSILQCRHAVIGILAIEGSSHLALASSGLDDGIASRLQASNPTGTVLGEILLRPDPIRVQAVPGERSRLGLPAFLPPVRSLLVVPVAVRSPGVLSGWLYFADKEGSAAFDDDDERLAATLAAQFVLAYGNLTLYDEVQRHAGALEAEAAEHRNTAEALRDSEQRFRQIATHIDAAFFLCEPDCSCIHYVSPAYETLWDRTCAGLYARPLSWLEPVHADDRERVRETFLRRSGAGLAIEIEFRVLRSDGSPRWILLRGFPIRNGSSKPYRTAAVAVDVSGARRAQDELQASNRRFTELLDNVELVSVMYDRAVRVTYCNEYLLQLTGWTRAEVLGCDWIEQFIPPEVDDMRAKFAALLHGDGAIQHLENEILTRAGERRLIRWNNTVLRSPQGEVTGVASIGEDVTEQRRAQAELAYSLTHDLVTGLPRFSQMGDYLQTVFVEAAARAGRVIVCYVDLDRFHTVNETRGRVVGDYVLRLVGGRLSELVGSDGRIAHIAGDEFAIILKDPSLAHDQFEFGETVRNAIEEPIEHNNRHIYITCSVGVSCFPDNGATPQELLRQAESAMLRAKHEGRNTVFAFANEHRQELEDRLTLGLRLDEALENAEFLLHYQPRISGQDWRICGFEALLRWDSPEFGLLPPKRFHQVAEDLGMMIDIGNYVLATACRQARAWIDAGADDFSISINISPTQMQRALFVDELRRALAEAALPARYIELELTEGMTNGNFDRVIGTMRALKALGVKLSLDDFGTGYSSLNYLRKFPIDTLKIDQSFVRDISTDVGATGVCRAIITLAHQLGMTVLAEGVETAAQVGYRRRNDCDFFQGYYFCKPVAAAKAFQLLQHRYLPHEGLEQTVAQPTLLLVDDEENILNALTRMLRRDGYRILTAKGAEEALDVLARNDVQVILSDQRMPGASGTEFLSKVKEMYPETVRMVLSGYTELAAVTAAINQGAIYKFITKPWNDEELRTQIRDAFRIANRVDKSYKREMT
jgi:diguanylate cyclase (GGDEF)-like protein/PAS domain S-box-containing protein